MTQTAGALEALGFDEVEPGLILDTPENRKAVYRLEPPGWQYTRVMDDEGLPTGLIRPIHPNRMTALRESSHSIYAPLLVDPDDAWSDYRGPDSFPLDAHAPYWVLDRLGRWRRQAQEGVPEDERRPFPIRCRHFRTDGTRCWLWASNPQDADVCAAHLRQKGTADARLAHISKIKLLEMAPDMVDRLEYIALHAEGEAVALKATTEILDRAGVRGGIELDVHHEVEVVDPSIAVKAKLDQLAERGRAKAELEARTRDTVPGEVIPNDTRPEPDGSRATD